MSKGSEWNLGRKVFQKQQSNFDIYGYSDKKFKWYFLETKNDVLRKKKHNECWNGSCNTKNSDIKTKENKTRQCFTSVYQNTLGIFIMYTSYSSRSCHVSCTAMLQFRGRLRHRKTILYWFLFLGYLKSKIYQSNRLSDMRFCRFCILMFFCCPESPAHNVGI